MFAASNGIQDTKQTAQEYTKSPKIEKQCETNFQPKLPDI